MICEVAVEGTLPGFDQLYSYAVPPSLTVYPGCRVRIPFASDRTDRSGVCVRVQEGDGAGLKPLSSVTDTAPVVDEQLLALAAWMTDTLFCTWYTALRPMLPPGSLSPYAAQTGETRIRVSDRFDPDTARLTEGARAILDFVSDNGGAAIAEVEYHTGCSRSAIRTLITRGALDEYQPVSPEAEPAIPADIRSLILTPEQQTVLNGLAKLLWSKNKPAVRGKTGRQTENASVPASVLLQQQGDGSFGKKTERQPAAVPSPSAALLYGVTGSGKTAVFLHLLASLFPDEGAIVLVPEISLTPQTVATFTRYFGDAVAVLHSGMTLADRRKSWERIHSGQATIVVGTRSAVFAPVKNLRLILMDEEQDTSYKSGRAPLYHARSIAKFRAAQSNGLLVMASATPSLETYASNIPRFSLTRRYNGGELPEVTLLDMREPLRAGETTAFHPQLLEALRDNLSRGEQSILLLNRRGYHTLLTCMVCGLPLTCPHCSVALTYHAANRRVMCHYCGYSAPMPETCPQCQGILKCEGAGTQQVEEQLGILLPEARLLRMDADTTRVRTAYEEGFTAFARGEYDILLGTQMVAKGLNFPNATLVGVLQADNALYSQDFRAYERAFTLFTQVVGRCGRGEKPGHAYIQTRTPENAVFAYAANQNYPDFFREEMRNRKLMAYPPYCTFMRIAFLSKDETAAREAARTYAGLFESRFRPSGLSVRLLAALEQELPKLSDLYRAQLLVKCRNNPDFRGLLRAVTADFRRTPLGRKVFCSIDPSFDGAF